MSESIAFDRGLHRRLIDGFYAEAMSMAEVSRRYFDSRGEVGEIEKPLLRMAFTSESLKVTTRLMHIIAWLMSQRAWERGELTDVDLADEKYRLGMAGDTDPAAIVEFPVAARTLIEGSQELYDRVQRLQDQMDLMFKSPDGKLNAPREMIDRLNSFF